MPPNPTTDPKDQPDQPLDPKKKRTGPKRRKVSHGKPVHIILTLVAHFSV